MKKEALFAPEKVADRNAGDLKNEAISNSNILSQGCFPPIDQLSSFEKIFQHSIESQKNHNEILSKFGKQIQSLVSVLQNEYSSIKTMFDRALDEAVALTHSKIGYIYLYNEERKEFRLNSWSKEVMSECAIIDPENTYSLEKTGWWGEAVRQRRVIFVNDYQAPNSFKKGFPEGHVKLLRFLTVPVFLNGKIVGVMGVANKETEYDDFDVAQLQFFIDIVWKSAETRCMNPVISEYAAFWEPPSGVNLLYEDHSFKNLVKQNRNGLIKTAVNPELMNKLLGDFVKQLDTNISVFETNGAMAYSIFSSGWCNLLSKSSRIFCNTDDDLEAISSKKWICHHFCWHSCGKMTIAKGQPIDLVCPFGIGTFAVPIRTKDRVAGSISFAYGVPPTDQTILKKISQKFNIDYFELEQLSHSYIAQPNYVTQMAKKRLQTTASLIGSMVETHKAESDLNQSTKMDAIGRLAGGVAHDFNNMLSIILGNAELAISDGPISESLQENLSNIISAGKKSADLTGQLLAFARKQTVQTKTFDMQEKVSQMLSMLNRLIGENIKISFKQCAENGLIHMDPGQLDQVLLNLVVNARNSISGSGKILIETSVTFIQKDERELLMEVPSGMYLVLSVADTGCGMSSETKNQIFEPFFSTREVGEGTGLGLSTVYGIIRQSGGTIHVYSEIGNGTVFKIFLPLVRDGLNISTENEDNSRFEKGSETILLVEDEPKLLQLTKKMLERLGYKVITANSAETALQLAEKFKSEVNLIFTDVVMPGIDGYEMLSQLKESIPDLKCLFMSGYTADIIEKQGRPNPKKHFIEKPFGLAQLAKKIREALQ